MIVAYVHGFLSGSQAVKSRQLRDHLALHHPGMGFLAPDYPDPPAEAIAALREFFAPYQGQDLGLVGSSMGGFYSTLLSIEMGFRAVLLNPCMHPQDYFTSLIGEQVNEATGERFVLRPEMLGTLRDLDARAQAYDPSRIKVYLQDGDETLDYTKAQSFFSRAPQVLIHGGCHRFERFGDYIEEMLAFLAGA
ncbi:MAG: hypothetical protein K6A65_07675 [Succinivibrionaceae bacterium]|nr:hypothetical protein [Succinivibrionaceae bacterium]